jgi:FMN phosphatase YigB (HAD superfamily)
MTKRFVPASLPVAAVVLDLDGTLYPLGPSHPDYLRVVGLGLRSLAGLGADEARAVLAGFDPGGGSSPRSASATFVELGVPLDRWNELRDQEFYPSESIVRDDVLVRAVDRLGRTRRLTLVTNTTARSCAACLAAAGFAPGTFDPVITAGDGLPPKPSPAPFLEVARRLGCAPAELFGVGDDWAHDIAPLAAIGGGGAEVRNTGELVALCDALASQPIRLSDWAAPAPG